MKKIYYKSFKGTSKKNNKDFYNVTFIEMDEKNGNTYERSVFVDKDVYDKITAKKFKFGDFS